MVRRDSSSSYVSNVVVFIGSLSGGSSGTNRCGFATLFFCCVVFAAALNLRLLTRRTFSFLSVRDAADDVLLASLTKDAIPTRTENVNHGDADVFATPTAVKQEGAVVRKNKSTSSSGLESSAAEVKSPVIQAAAAADGNGDESPALAVCRSDQDCGESKACALKFEDSASASAESSKVCCPGGAREFSNLESDLVCEGLQVPGGPCSADWFCASDLCLRGKCSDRGRSSRLAADGQPCGEGGECENGACALETEEGNGGEGSSRMICCPSRWSKWSQLASDSVCERGQKVDGVCSADEFCAAGLYCVSGTCRGKKLSANEKCESDGDCVNGACGLAREDSDPSTSPPPKVCCPSSFHEWSDALSDSVCEGSQKNGRTCSADYFCESRVCIRGTCRASKSSAGEACDDDLHCTNSACAHKFDDQSSDVICCDSGRYVNSGKRVYVCTGQVVGANCSSDDMCSSKVCNQGTCRERPAEAGEICDSPNDCVGKACGRELEDSSSDYLCCPSGNYEWSGLLKDFVCTGQKVNARCSDDKICQSGNCEESVCKDAAAREQVANEL